MLVIDASNACDAELADRGVGTAIDKLDEANRER